MKKELRDELHGPEVATRGVNSIIFSTKPLKEMSLLLESRVATTNLLHFFLREPLHFAQINPCILRLLVILFCGNEVLLNEKHIKTTFGYEINHVFKTIRMDKTSHSIVAMPLQENLFMCFGRGGSL
jgi:hypothetical protein